MKKPPMLSPQAIRKFQKKLYDFYRKHGRKLPWRNTTDPYEILVSEIMLQQTQVVRVIEKYKQFIYIFSHIESLARAPLLDIMKVWQGLGYNRRALALKKLAEIVVSQYDGKIPSSVEALKALPGIGGATAHAICAFAFNQPTTFIETNIRSVFIHHFFRNRDDIKDEDILPLIANTMDKKNPRIWYYALMDYGAALKQKHVNPGRRSTHYKKQTSFKDSNRQIRGIILKELVKKPKVYEASLFKKLNFDKDRVKEILKQLNEEGFILKEGTFIKIR
jgi:A/G-specific adenine glycosylase